ncbi:MAG: ABC transporter permease [Oxalobacter sp.]|nr:ABC transporter permease [Oxalobacter sp.]
MVFTIFSTLFGKEVKRFFKVSIQTVMAPVLTSLLYMLIFGHALSDYVQVYPGVAYSAFLVPGLVMMTLMQNAFANSSSSLIQAKINGSIIFMLLSPASYAQIFFAYMLASVVRGIVVGIGVFIVTVFFIVPSMYSFLWVLFFGIGGAALLGTMGIVAGIWAEKYEHLSTFQNFMIMPATFLSGVFYSIHSLPDFWQGVSVFNPFFYLVDGFRYGFFGHSDVNPWTSLMIVSIFFCFFAVFTLHLLRKGYKLRF